MAAEAPPGHDRGHILSAAESQADSIDDWLLRTLASTSAPPASLASGRYRVLRVLGEGAQKLVLLVHDTSLGRECALSLVRADRLDTPSLDRFRREAQAIARLGPHPHIVTIYDLGDDGGRPYIACEYLTGGDLRRLLYEAGGALPVLRAIAIARDICRALAFAHAQGLVHRDVKPENIWLSSDGAAKLGDFGVALAAARSRLTAPGAVVGTVSYLAPEQAQGQPVAASTDLYALGCVLYELLTGRPPFVGDDFMSVLSQQVHAPPVSARERNPAVPAAIDRLVLRMLAKRREDRPASAEALFILEQLSIPGAADDLTDTRGPQLLQPLASTRFVGRRTELNHLKRAVEQALTGRGATCALAGEPGIGKSRLAEELGLYATQRGMRVIYGQCSDAEGAPPYLPFLEALDTGLQAIPAQGLSDMLGARAPLIARLLPQLMPRLPKEAAALSSSLENDRYVLFQGVSDFLRDLAAPAGLLLVLEDLHWADEPSLRLLQHVARHLSGARVLVLASYRDVEVDRRHPLRDLLADLRREQLCERITLRGLALDEVQALVGEEAMPEALARALLRETEGNPFFVCEVLKHLAEEGSIAWRGGLLAARGSFERLAIPEGVREVIDRRLARLSDPTRRMLTQAAAMGASFRWDLLVAASGEDEAVLLDALDEALAAQILRPQPTGREGVYEFVHTLIRHALYQALSGPRRARLHRAIGEALERLYSSAPAAHLDELAHHYFRAGSSVADKTISYSVRAGDQAAAVLAYEQAAAHYERALQMMSGPEHRGSSTTQIAGDLHAKRAAMLAHTGAWEEARRQFEAALTCIPPERQERRAELLVDLAMVCFWAQDVPSLRQHASEALKLAEALGREDLAAGAQGALAAARSADGEVRESIGELRRALVRAGGRRTDAVARGMQMCSLQLYWVGDYELAIAQAKEAAASARAVGDAFVLMAALPQLGLALSGSGRYQEALQAFEEARRFGRDHNIGGFFARAIVMSAGLHFDLYDDRRAEFLVEEARDLGRSVGFPPPVLNGGLDLLRIHVRCGQIAKAEGLVNEVRDDVDAAVAWHGWLWKLRFAQGRAELALAKGDWQEAHRLASDVIARSRATGRVKYEVEGLLARGRAFDGLRRGGHALMDRQRAVAVARLTADPAAFVRAAAELLRVREDAALALEARENAKRIIARLPDGELRRSFEKAEPVAALLR